MLRHSMRRRLFSFSKRGYRQLRPHSLRLNLTSLPIDEERRENQHFSSPLFSIRHFSGASTESPPKASKEEENEERENKTSTHESEESSNDDMSNTADGGKEQTEAKQGEEETLSDHLSTISGWINSAKSKLFPGPTYRPPLPGQSQPPPPTTASSLLDSVQSSLKGAVKETIDDFRGKRVVRQEVYVGKTPEELEAEEEARKLAEAEKEIEADPRHGLTDGPWTSAVDLESREVYFYRSTTSEDDTSDSVWEVPEGHFKEIDWEKLREENEIRLQEEAEEAERNRGPTALVKVKAGKSSWERFTATLRAAPLIKDILKDAEKLQRDFKKSDIGKGAQKIGDRVEDTKEEIAERLETSQHPWVYAVSNAWDELQEETNDAQLIRELTRIDPDFEMYTFLDDVEKHYVREFLTAFYAGERDALSGLCTRRYYETILEPELEFRRKEGMVMDPTVLDVDECNVLKALPTGSSPEHKDPGLLVSCNTEVVYCVMNAKDGKVIEGALDRIHQVRITLYLVRQYSPQTNTVSWKVEEVQQDVISDNYL